MKTIIKEMRIDTIEDCLGTETVVNSDGEVMLYEEAHEIDGEYYPDSECTLAEDTGEYILTEEALYCETNTLFYSDETLHDGVMIDIEGSFFLSTDEQVAQDEEGEWFLVV